MVKNKLNIALGAALAVSTFLWTGCSDEFLQEKKNYSHASPEIYETYEGASLRINNLYRRLLPSSRADVGWATPERGTTGDFESRATEEFAGFDSETNSYVNPNANITAPFFDRFYVSRNVSNSPFGQVRNCNEIIESITASKGLTDKEKKELLGQAYFFRAWQYFLLVRTYGGIPIVDKVQAADVSEAQELSIPRATTKECIDFMCTDLDTAASMLARYGPKEYGRVTAATALAVKGRILLLYASPLFNRADKADRWKAAYDANKAALEQAHAEGFALHNEGNPGMNASGWSHQFSVQHPTEAVFVTLHNDNWNDNAAIELYLNNPREQSMRPYNTLANSGSGVEATVNMIDLFPMADGKRAGTSSTFNYQATTWAGQNVVTPGELNFWADRDPRFYRTFAFPGVRWRFDGTPLSWTYPSGVPQRVRYNGSDYVLWNYVWYNQEQPDDIGGFAADGLDKSYKGVYVRKRSNDFDLAPMSGVPLYKIHYQGGQAQFGSCAAPHIELRYTEILLNLAEAAVGIGELNEAFTILKRIRARAGYDVAIAGADYGLVLGGRPEMFAAVLYERQIELAYEGKRFEDMRRWLLWDGGATQSEIAASWVPTGWGGNTCTYLGVEQFNGKRRDYMELRVRNNYKESNDRNNTGDPFYDPLTKSVNRPAPLDLKLSFSAQEQVIEDLKAFYSTNLVRRIRRGDGKEGAATQTINFRPYYYFMGLNSGAQNNNQSLLQTMGWTDARGHGSFFDPLAEPN